MRLLEGIRVVEVCQMVAGPYASRILADLGADVIKVERPSVGDSARHKGPFARGTPDQECSILFLALNTSKKGITLDISHDEGRVILQRLLGEADLLIEDNAPALALELGLDYASLSQSNPRLVVLSITPFGQTGPYRDYKAYPLNTFHSGGQGYVTPGGSIWPERPPLKQGRYVGEYEVGICAVPLALAALFHQRATGSGQHVDLSKQEAQIQLGVREFQPYLSAGRQMSRFTPVYALGGTMPCKDGYVQLSLHEEHQWRGLVAIMGDPEWANEDWFKDPARRIDHANEINAHIRKWLQQHTKEEIFQLGQTSGCSVAPYYSAKEVVEQSALKDTGFFVEVEHPVAGTFRYPTASYRFGDSAVVPEPAPLLGQHNQQVYCDLLGYTSGQLAQLRQVGVI